MDANQTKIAIIIFVLFSIRDTTPIFTDRHDAGKQLGKVLLDQKSDISHVFGIPRGGIVTAYEVSHMLHKPLHVLVARKIGSPNNPEFGIGAIAEGGIKLLDSETINYYKIPKHLINMVIRTELKELIRRKSLYSKHTRFPSIKNKIIVIIDDGVATGYTALTAIRSARKKSPKSIIFASPICATESYAKLICEADEVKCLFVVDDLRAIGRYYRSFTQTSDKIIERLLSSTYRK